MRAAARSLIFKFIISHIMAVDNKNKNNSSLLVYHENVDAAYTVGFFILPRMMDCGDFGGRTASYYYVMTCHQLNDALKLD